MKNKRGRWFVGSAFALGFLFMATPARAAIPVIDMDNIAETVVVKKVITEKVAEEAIEKKLIEETIKKHLIDDILMKRIMSLTGVPGVGDLDSLVGKLTGIVGKIDLLSELQGKIGEMLQGKMSDFATNVVSAKEVEDRVVGTGPGRAMVQGQYTEASKRIYEELDALTEENAEKVGGGEPGASAAWKAVAKTAPLSIPDYQHGVVMGVYREGATALEQEKMLLVLAQDGKARALARTMSILSAYEAPEGKQAEYQKVFEEIVTKSKEMAEQAKGLPTGPGDAIKTIAGLSAIQAELLAMQNVELYALAQVLRDSVRMSGAIATVDVERHSASLYENMNRYRAIFERSMDRLSQ